MEYIIFQKSVTPKTARVINQFKKITVEIQMEDRHYKLAKKRVEKKKGFYTHFAVYIAVGAFFFVMNMVTQNEEPTLWFFYPMLPWGIAIFIHYFSVFGLPGTDILTEDWEERELEKELSKIKRDRPALPPEQEEEFPLDEFEEPRKEKMKRENWDGDDFV
ncbi:MAG: 2TM domain-containing protein [Bacteroidota bacterium]